MALDSSNVDRPGLVVTIVLCPYCDAKYPTENTGTETCERCKKVFDVATNEFEANKKRITENPDLCTCHLRRCKSVWCKGECGCLKCRDFADEADNSEQTFWWQRL